MPALSFESRLVLVIGLLFGGIALLVVPPIITFDGPGHFTRSIQVARGDFRAAQLGPNSLGGEFSHRHTQFADELWADYWQRKDWGTLERWSALSERCIHAEGSRAFDLTNIAIESPVNHFVQGVGMRLGRLFQLGPLGESRLGCLFNLLAYLALVVLSLEILPGARRLFLLFALTPLAIVQAASLSHDAVNFALPLLLVAIVWRLRVRAEPLPTWGLAGVVALGSLVALLKPVAIANLACVLVIPTATFGSVRRRWITLAALFSCAGALWLYWNLAFRHLDLALAMDPSRPIHASSAMKAWALEHPLAFLAPFGRFLWRDLWEQWPTFFGGVGGWISPSAMDLLTRSSVIFLLGAVGSAEPTTRRDGVWSTALLVQTLGLLFGTCLVCWLALGTVGQSVVPGLGGRYLPIVYFGLIAGVHGFLPCCPKPWRQISFYGALAANLVGLLAVLIPTALAVVR